jgi:hypothetical protein
MPASEATAFGDLVQGTLDMLILKILAIESGFTTVVVGVGATDRFAPGYVGPTGEASPGFPRRTGERRRAMARYGTRPAAASWVRERAEQARPLRECRDCGHVRRGAFRAVTDTEEPA